MPQPGALTLILAAMAAWLVIGLAGVVRPRNLLVVSRALFPAGAAVGLAVAVIGALAIGSPPQSTVLPLGLPDLPFHLRLDSLSAFFLLLLGAAGAAISLYAGGYFRSGEATTPGLLCLEYHVFLAAMALVLLADDAYVFMVSWEAMALSSYFLVTTDHRVPEIRHAGFLYLLIAHIGALAILLCFGVLQGGGGDYTFGSMRSMTLEGAWPSVAFFLALFGFGAKAGLLPMHIWLPEAHPAAPSPVSALMSGVMLKTAIYGLLRVSFDLVQTQLWWWGVVALMLGLATALFGVIFACVQSDMKRLLAYSSIENIGVIVAGIGLAILFKANAKTLLAAITLTAVLYHALNHAFFKSLLFLATGSVLHATHERSLGKLGGLIHRMPWVAWSALVGTLAIAGLPPLNGFISEWLLLQAFLFTPTLPQSFVNMLVPLAAGALVLAVALSAYVMVKFYGIVFLGRHREPNLVYARDAGLLERIALSWLALGCVVLGIFPLHVIALLAPVDLMLIGASPLGESASTWLLLAPISADRASYSPIIMLIVLVLVVMLTMKIVHRFYHGRVRSAPPWDCGFPQQTPRMQDTAEGFGQPIRVVFDAFFRIERSVPSPFDAAPKYAVEVTDHFWRWLYLPIARGADAVARVVGMIQQGRIGVYLTYSFLTLLVILFLRAMTPTGILLQLLQVTLALLLAPLLLGWVNQCRAWLSNKSAPPILLPYWTLRKLFTKDAVVADHVSPVFRVTPYIVFSAMCCAAAIIPSLATDLPFALAADAIALVGLFALARVFIALAAMDIGTAFGSLGARREMFVGFLAEPALLMVLFTASLISGSTSLPTIVDTLSQRQLAIYPSLAFAGVAFTMVSLAENARIPVDNPTTHLELTMIHEAMILEYSARHLALIEWASALKLFNYSCIGLALFFPFGVATAGAGLTATVAAVPILVAKLAVGGFALALIETLSAKMRIFRAPEFLGTAFLLAVLAMLVNLLLGS